MWEGTKVLVTGGASFIGSHLVDSLQRKGADVTMADDFSSGRLENLEYSIRKKGKGVWKARGLWIHCLDLKDKIRDFAHSV